MKITEFWLQFPFTQKHKSYRALFLWKNQAMQYFIKGFATDIWWERRELSFLMHLMLFWEITLGEILLVRVKYTAEIMSFALGMKRTCKHSFFQRFGSRNGVLRTSSISVLLSSHTAQSPEGSSAAQTQWRSGEPSTGQGVLQARRMDKSMDKTHMEGELS